MMEKTVQKLVGGHKSVASCFGREQSAQLIQDRLGWGRDESVFFVEVFLDQMTHALACDHELKINGFGSFSVKDKRPRWARNPKTGTPALVEARRVIRFLASRQLNDRLNKRLLVPVADTRAVSDI